VAFRTRFTWYHVCDPSPAGSHANPRRPGHWPGGTSAHPRTGSAGSRLDGGCRSALIGVRETGASSGRRGGSQQAEGVRCEVWPEPAREGLDVIGGVVRDLGDLGRQHPEEFDQSPATAFPGASSVRPSEARRRRRSPRRCRRPSTEGAIPPSAGRMSAMSRQWTPCGVLFGELAQRDVRSAVAVVVAAPRNRPITVSASNSN
jgi:hypothetical protein